MSRLLSSVSVISLEQSVTSGTLFEMVFIVRHIRNIPMNEIFELITSNLE